VYIIYIYKRVCPAYSTSALASTSVYFGKAAPFPGFVSLGLDHERQEKSGLPLAL
jgi:hypothetical protein